MQKWDTTMTELVATVYNFKKREIQNGDKQK